MPVHSGGVGNTAAIPDWRRATSEAHRCEAAISGYPVAMARKQPKRNFGTRLRSAVTGRFVKSGQAKRSPRTTVTERIPIGRRGKGKKR